jgi:hypothetical protein
MAKLSWKPWHQVVRLRDDLKSGELPLHMFAADLYEVMMQNGKRPIYENPDEFFTLTYATENLRNLVRDVVLRLAGKNDKAVRQLELTYGGGKTWCMIPRNCPIFPRLASSRLRSARRPRKLALRHCASTNSTLKQGWRCVVPMARCAD